MIRPQGHPRRTLFISASISPSRPGHSSRNTAFPGRLRPRRGRALHLGDPFEYWVATTAWAGHFRAGCRAAARACPKVRCLMHGTAISSCPMFRARNRLALIDDPRRWTSMSLARAAPARRHLCPPYRLPSSGQGATPRAALRSRRPAGERVAIARTEKPANGEASRRRNMTSPRRGRESLRAIGCDLLVTV